MGPSDAHRLALLLRTMHLDKISLLSSWTMTWARNLESVPKAAISKRTSPDNGPFSKIRTWSVDLCSPFRIPDERPSPFGAFRVNMPGLITFSGI